MSKFWLRAAWDVLCTIVMTAIVWRHAHWSVTLALFCLLLRANAQDALDRARKP